MVRFTMALAAGVVFAPVMAAADMSEQDTGQSGLAELLASAEDAEAQDADQQPVVVLDVLPAKETYEPADFAAYRQAGAFRCPNCGPQRYRRTYSFDPVFLHRLGYRWDNRSRLGLAFNAGAFRYGFWGDVREVNALSTEDSGLVPSLGSLSDSGIGTYDSGLAISAPAVGNTGAVRSTASFSAARSVSFNAAAPVSARAVASPQFTPSGGLGRSGSGADTSYTEYIGGIFIAAPF